VFEPPSPFDREGSGKGANAMTVAADPPRGPSPQSGEQIEPGLPRWFSFARHLGPGLVSGASDNDPSGIATYTQIGAQLGYAAFWIMPLCYPMMIASQEISARIGYATGGSVISVIARRYSGWIVQPIVALVVFANVVNLGADLGAMAAVLHLLIGGPNWLYVPLFGVLCAGLLILLDFDRYTRTVKWAALSLFAYFFTVISVHVDWLSLLRHSFIPTLPTSVSALNIVVAALGTTISPYLFIWQSSLEGELARGQPHLHGRSPAMIDAEVSRIRVDTYIGMAVANLVAYAVIVTAAVTLHASGVREIDTAAQAAEALRPSLGPLAYAVFSFGILATGLLAVPMLAGSAAYAFGEGRHWPVGLARKTRDASAFYGCIVAAMAAGIVMNFTGIDPVRALIWSAVINGVLSAPVLVLMMLVAMRKDVMGSLRLHWPLITLGWLTTLVMAAAAVALAIGAAL
jgi:Mn2+/Fe2+ NRAMP family transporter